MTVLGKVGRDGRHGVDGDQRRGAAAVAPGELHAREHERGAAVGGGADLEQAQRVGHHGRGQHLVDGDLLAVAGVRVGQAVAGVLHLDLREVLLGGAEAVHAPAGVEREVGRVGGAHADGSAASPGRPCARRRPGRRSPWAWCPRRRPARRRTGRPGSAPGRWRWPPHPRRRRRRRWTRGPRSSRAPGRTWRPRRSPGSRCGWCRPPRRTACRASPSPASARASRAAASPYSTKGRPHLPHSCMPAPSTATLLSSGIAQSSPPPAAATGRHFQTR